MLLVSRSAVRARDAAAFPSKYFVGKNCSNLSKFNKQNSGEIWAKMNKQIWAKQRRNLRKSGEIWAKSCIPKNTGYPRICVDEKYFVTFKY